MCFFTQPVPVQDMETSNSSIRQAYVKIIEQPVPKVPRFRYKCEGKSGGALIGVSSTPKHKTFPTIQVVGYQGRAIVVVSCVTKEKPYRPHPHHLVGREGCKRGICTLEIPSETMTIQFCKLGVQCIKKMHIEEELQFREEIGLDPFRTGFAHKTQLNSIGLDSVRLCFQVFLEGDRKGKFTYPLKPVVSAPIIEMKSNPELAIFELSDCVSSVDGNRKNIILLCGRVTKDDIQVRFFEEKDGVVVWEGLGDFQPAQVHKQVAISFKPPKYHNLKITEPVKVFIQLRRPSDGEISEPLPFEYLPIHNMKRKRHKFDELLGLEEIGRKKNAYEFLCGGIKNENQFDLTRLQNMPSTSSLPPSQKWNIPYMPNLESITRQSTNPTEIPDSKGIISFLDLDSHNEGLNQIDLNSIDLGNPYGGRDDNKNGNQLNVSSLQNIPYVPPPSSEDWNIPYIPNLEPSTSVNPGNMEFIDLSTLLDLDSHHAQLKEISLNSGDLSINDESINIMNLSDTLNTQLSLSDILEPQDLNMSDSLTRMTNNIIAQEMNMFK